MLAIDRVNILLVSISYVNYFTFKFILRLEFAIECPECAYFAEVLSTSPGSTDMSDPEKIHRKIIEILCDQNERTEEIKRLQELVKSKSKKLFS